MLEGLAAWVLKTYIGKYINVNPDKLSIGLLSGVVELENVPLNPDAFNDFDVPFELKLGFFGKIKLNVSLNTLRYTPWSLVAENLCIIFGPRKSEPTKTEAKNAEKLSETESKWFKEVELLGLDDDTNKSERQSLFFKYLTPIAYSLLNNINVSINELHIRYEDEANSFSFGAKIDSISIKNDPDQSKNLEDSGPLSSKLFELKNFSVYSDSNFYSSKADFFQIQLAPSVEYIINPTSFQAYMIRNLSPKPLRKRKHPRIRIRTHLSDFNMSLKEGQIENFCKLHEFCNVYKNFTSLAKLRDEGLSKWAFIIKSIKIHIKKTTWSDVKNWARDVTLYRQIIEKTYQNETLTETQVSEKTRIETEWDYGRLLIVRRAIFEKYILSEKYKSTRTLQTKPTLFNYLNFYGFFNYNKKNESEIDQEVIDLINDTIENDTLLRRDSLLAVMEFKLENWEINLNNLARFKLEQTELVIEALPRYDSFLFEMNLGSFYLTDILNKSTTFFPNIIYPKLIKDPGQTYVFSLCYEHKPLNSKNSSLKIRSCGFDCIFNRDLYSGLIGFFDKTSSMYQKAEGVLLRKKSKSKSFNFKTSPIHKLNFNFEIIAPKILIPENYCKENSNCLILDFGKLIFKNRQGFTPSVEDDVDDSEEEFITPASTPPNELEEPDTDLSKYYSNFDLNLNNLQVLSGKLVSNNLKYYLAKGHSNFHLLEKFDINIQLGILMKINLNKVVSFYFNPQLPPVRVQVHVNLVKLNIDDLKLINLYKTIQLVQGVFQNRRTRTDKFKLPFRPKRTEQFLEIDLKLNEVDITMSVQNIEIHENLGHIDPRSICELKIYMIKSLVQLNNKFDVNFNLSLFSMLLIDARQIYGSDYQLLAASHENILLDSNGVIINRITGLKEDLSKNTKPLISIELTLTSQIESQNFARYDELNVDVSFSTLDLVLNPETISEIVILVYGVYLNIKKPGDMKTTSEPIEDVKSDLNSKVNFKFNRITALMFKIEDDESAHKVAIFALDGVFTTLTVIPEIKFLEIQTQIEGFNVTNLCQTPSLVFSIGQLYDNVRDSSASFVTDAVFSLNFSKSLINNEENKELKLKIASLCYMHNPKLIYDLEQCFKDFMRFHEKIMEEVTDKAAKLALEMIKKGKDYLENKLAEIYELNELKKITHNPKSKFLKIKVQLETPVIVVPIVGTSQFYVAHLGQIKIKNDLDDQSSTKFCVNLKDVTVFSTCLDSVNETLFHLFYDPMNRENLIDKTDISLNLSYEPNFDHVNKKRKSGGWLGVVSKIDNCKIRLSKLSLERLIKISDSLIYAEKNDDFKVETKSKSRPIKFGSGSLSTPISSVRENGFSAENFDNFEQIFSFMSDKDDKEDETETSLDTCIDIWFKIEKLEIDFLADVEHRGQQIAELFFNEYELNINKEYSNITDVSMLLKSMFLIDKLVKTEHEKNYLLWSGTSRTGRQDNFIKQINENLSFSAPSLGKNMNILKYYRKSKKFKKNHEFLTNMFELSKFYNCESTSLPSELSKPRISQDHSLKSETIPSTPPPSPTSVRKKKVSESLANLTTTSENPTDPLVKINLILIDERHDKFRSKYQKINRFLDIKFSRLKLIVNPETWILVLDVLGLGSKSYPIGSKVKVNEDKKSSTGIKFRVEEFTIELNESEQNSPMTKFKIDNVNAFVETRPEFMRSNGQLGSLAIYDVSPTRGLYPDKFLTSGEQALEFEFFKHVGPMDELLESKEFDISLKLIMSSVKYVHTQRFLVSITQYFQQFNQLQEALGKMNAISSGEKNISYAPNRSSRIKLDIQTESPIIVIPVHSKSDQVLVFNLGNIQVTNKFLSSNETVSFNLSDISFASSANNSICMNDEEKECLLDLIEIKFSNTHLYSACRYRLTDESKTLNDDLTFITFGFKNTGLILNTENDIYFNLERNLENEISHKSPDWYLYSKLSSVQLKVNLSQYKLIRGLLDQNLGEQINTKFNSALVMANTYDTVLTGRVWKQISLNFDLENVLLELLNDGNKPLAFAALIKSSLIFESFSDGSKLVDLVSNEIKIKDTRGSIFDVLLKKESENFRTNQKLQLEVHFKSSKLSNRYSILFNNCRVITLLDWLMEMKRYFQQYQNLTVQTTPQPQPPMEIKINLTNTDFVLVEQISDLQSQAIILRLTAYMEFNERKQDPIDTCLQSLELFTCQMNDIEQTALSIIEPVTFNIYVKKKTDDKYTLEINADKFRMRFSYLDFKLFIKVMQSVKKQIELENKPTEEIISEKVDYEVQDTKKMNLQDLILWIGSFSVCIIDDCNDIDIPLGDILFNRFSLNHQFEPPNRGAVEFVLNVDYYNRLLSGWEPLVEPWLARLNWKSKITSNVFTLTSMDVLNLNLTNPFIQILSETLSNWKNDFDTGSIKTHKIFQPYKFINLTGQSINFLKLNSDGQEWTQLGDKQEKEFNFFKQTTIYAQRSHNNQLRNVTQNKIRIKLDEWSEIRPLSVDKVGTYFRDIYRMSTDSGPKMTRLIFDISLKENATKFIEIKSPVTIRNRLNFKLKCKIESCLNVKLGMLTFDLDLDQEISVPIRYLPCNIWLKPIDLESEFSSSCINLNECSQPGQVDYLPLTCGLANDKPFYFFAKIKRHKFQSDLGLSKNIGFISGHSIYIEPAFSVHNLLPIELRYNFLSVNTGRIDSNELVHFTDINVSNPIEFMINIDNYILQKSIEIHPQKMLANLELENSVSNRKFTVLRRVNFYDEKGRPLFLIGRIVFKIGSSGIKSLTPIGSRQGSIDDTRVYPITFHLSAVYCFFNLTGLPLIFRQYNCDEASGQLEEHETVCSTQPLLFSFNDIDSPYACSMRIGKSCIDFNLNNKSVFTPKWCKPFGLDSGSSFRPVHVSFNQTDENLHNPDRVYYIGIDIKQGKDLHKDTTFVYFSTRFYLVNKSSRNLFISQNHFIKSERERGLNLNWSSKKTLTNSVNSILLLKDSMSQFHWSRSDFDQLLSIRPSDDLSYNWSGGFKIDQIDSFYTNCRHPTNDFIYFKVEIFLDGGTFYIVFTDELNFPFPVRIENISEVPIYVYQPSTLEESHNIILKPKTNFNYCWDEQVLEHKLAIGVKGGTCSLFDLNMIQDKKTLFYENFFYIVFKTANDNRTDKTGHLEHELVLTYSRNRIYLDIKEPGNRAQLWSLTNDGYLIHESSSPPREMGSLPDLSTSYVLDIDEVAPRPNHFMPLTVRRPDIRRKNTQKWTFEGGERLICNVRNMCLQATNELSKGEEVFLGPVKSTNQIVTKEQLRPGSGYLAVNMFTDGPTRVIKISNIRNKSYLSINWEKSEETEPKPVKKSMEIYVNLTGGIGVSVINWKEQEYEELIYAYFKSIEISFDQNLSEQKLILGIQSIQVCNQLLNATRQNLVYTSQTGAKHDLALKIDFLRKFRPDKSPIYIEHLIIDLLDLNLQIEEKLLWKLIQFLRASKQLNLETTHRFHIVDASATYYKNQITKLLADSQAAKYSFNKFQISDLKKTLSVYKTPKLNTDLLKIKSSLGIPLIQFENASIECKPFVLMNEHDTVSCILNLISKHYEQELRSHAIGILGSVDFLGNPLGLVVDFKESITNILSNGHVTDFVFSITHGVANSVSKFSGSLSDELNELSMDERHRETREQIRSLYSNGSVDHFVGGALGFAVGVVGGALSLGTQTYRGFYENGVSGAFTGLMRGAVGTVSKPIVGMLDFATGIASAIKETSKTVNKMEVPRIRESRCCSTSGALLTQFSRSDANGQKILYQVNDFNLDEKFIAMEQLKGGQAKFGSGPKTEQIIGLVTNQRVLFVKSIDFEFRIEYEYTFQQLKGNRALSVLESNNSAFLVLHVDEEQDGYKFMFESIDAAKSLEDKIRHAKEDYDETFYILHNYKDEEN